ncbi:glycosyltransferase 87 family protein [Streptacidiphilus carbonis]|jgi:hypothetical protein|uniref:glycosyltransferase 87 family protein n=1 Tax=Streptacidiphilus carbonis TaxID=105422 RepID=UPI000694A82F|nr:glycosyltransferase 87 family protein [Streptacidiphilus carbonis]
MPSLSQLTPRDPVRRARLVVLGAALAVLALKIWLAATTHGTQDVSTFTQFARVIGKVGPVGIYGVPHPAVDLYNHPPLTGDLLWLLWHISRHGVPFALLIRIPASVADVFTSLLVFSLVRAWRKSTRQAMWAGIGTACSPVLVIISGFHGNTDPVFILFLLLSVWLLTERRLPLPAGIAFALAVSIKVVPLVALPVLLLWALLHSRRTLLMFLGGLAVTLVVIWGPAAIGHWPQLRTNVLGYNGWSAPQWGLAQLLSDLGMKRADLHPLLDHLRTPVVAASALLGMLLVWRRRDALGPAVGISLACLLLLSTATGTQYLSWAVAGLFVAEAWTGLLYSLVGGAFLFQLYDAWSKGTWDVATAIVWTHEQVQFGLAAWASLGVAVVFAVRAVLRSPRTGRTAPLSPRSTAEASGRVTADSARAAGTDLG